MRSNTGLAAVLLIVSAGSGCQSVSNQINYLTGESGCKEYYRSVGENPKYLPFYSKENRPPPIVKRLSEQNENPEVWIIQAMGQGYEALGACTFYGAASEGEFTPVHAKFVGADAVISVATYKDTQYASTQSGGYSYRTYDWTEWYFQKAKDADELKLGFFIATSAMGFYAEDLESTDRSSLKRNTGILVKYVVKDSPAFYAGLVPGDVVIGIDGKEVMSTKELGEIVGTRLGAIARENMEKIDMSAYAGLSKSSLIIKALSLADQDQLGNSELSFIRDGVEKTTAVKFMRMYEAENIFGR